MNMNSDLKQLVMAVSLGCMGASPAFAGTSCLGLKMVMPSRHIILFDYI